MYFTTRIQRNARACPECNEGTPIAYTVTTDGGRFVIEADSDLQTLLGGFLHQAKNIPVKVRAVLESRQPPAPPTRKDSSEGVSTNTT
ncbi:hypothetical protein HYR99_34270 [Candidatus Poribacteria bacterium]|nr:hypothetical protein [Candidatus Poribacteria bacterium]